MPRKSPIDIGLENTTTFRLVNPDDTGNVAIARLAISETGCVFHLMGFVKVFRTIATNGDAEHWASSNLNMTELERKDMGN